MALNYLKACYELSIKIKNQKLKLDCLLNIIPISSLSEEYQNKIFNILKDTYAVAMSRILRSVPSRSGTRRP